MSKLIYAMKDVKVGKFITVFIDENHVSAVRGLESMLIQGKSLILDYPSDFEMYHLGEVDMQTGKLIQNEHPVFIVSGAQALESVRMRMRQREAQEKQTQVGDLVKRLENSIEKPLPHVLKTENMRKEVGSDK